MVAMKQVWPQELWAGAEIVMFKESRGHASSVNPAGYYGCFQVDSNASLDALVNAKAGYAKYVGAKGWYPWPPVKGILW